MEDLNKFIKRTQHEKEKTNTFVLEHVAGVTRNNVVPQPEDTVTRLLLTFSSKTMSLH